MLDEIVETRKSFWQVWTYDVFGNRDEGFEVNDRCKIAGTHKLTEIDRGNGWQDLDEKGILEAFGFSCGLGEIDIEWQDENLIYVNAVHDGRPIGELVRVDSLGRIVQ